MDKKEFCMAVADELHWRLDCVEPVINAAIDVLTQELACGQRVRFRGLGTFEVIQKHARKGVNPRTGETILIPAHNRPVFRAGKSLKTAVNNRKWRQFR